MSDTKSRADVGAVEGHETAVAIILRDRLLLRAGAWLGGYFRRYSGAAVRLPINGAGFQERLQDIPIPDWPYREDEAHSRDALDLFVRAGLLSRDVDGNYHEVADRHDLLLAFILYYYREVERFSDRFPRLSGAVAGRRVLDAGCGVGAYALYLRDLGARTVVALDYSLDRLAVTKELAAVSGGGVLTVRGSVECLPLPDASVDLIHSRVVLPYVHQRRTVAEFARVLAPGGRAVLMLHSASFYRWQLNQIGVRRRYASDAVLALMGLAGGAVFSLLGSEPRWSTGHSRFYLSYQPRRAFSRLVESKGFRIDRWDANERKPIVWLSKTA